MSLQYILFLGGFFAIAIIFQIVAVTIHNKSKQQFESENPDASIMLIKKISNSICLVLQKL